MILIDVNVVVACHRDDHPQHGVARRWLDGLVARDEPFATTDGIWAAFTRLSTNPRAFAVPTPAAEAFSFITAVCSQPSHSRLTAGPRHIEIFQRLCVDYDATGDLVPDAHLAAIAIEHDCVLASFDRDFARFSPLRWIVPEG